ncbi:MlaD family protein [Conexibacter sp. SYSU D00693]|uniref:MlaD family protein n=1 Tax=Conexibacter sp. SYSU D00693 TaxID=2812560 RepID=UPI00196AE403|nr:MlaD family protein [Conexibacter sp. SYSU D00693]
MSRLRATTRRVRRYDDEPPVRVLGRGVAVLVLLAAFGWLSVKLYDGVPGRDYRFVDAQVPQVGNLISHDPVRLGGVRVGQVKAVDSGPGGTGRLELQIEPGTDLRADTGIRIRANGLLGSRYVELLPGRSREPLADGRAIVGGHDTLTYGATDALDVLDRETRGALRPLVGELGTGLAGQGRNVNDLLRAGAREIGPTSELFAALRTDATARLLPSLHAALVPLDDRRVALSALPAAASDALTPFVTERDATRATLDAAPGALAAAQAGLGAGRPLLVAAQGLSRAARRVLPDAPGALRATRALLAEAQDPLRKARPLLAEVEPTVPAALRVTSAADPLLKPVVGLADDLRRMADQLAPYGCDIKNFGAVFRSMTGLGARAPGGPNGAPMQFRLQIAAPVPTEALSMQDTTGLVVRDGYPDPCEYLAKPYPIIDKPQALARRGR